MNKIFTTLVLCILLFTSSFSQVVQNFVSPGPPIATGQAKFLGGVSSAPQKINFNKYWNQVTPENGGKWGAVEGTRGVFNWSDLDSAYKLAKLNHYPFKMHNLIWGSQQPTWIETLAVDVQLAEIKNWYAAVAYRYPDIDMMDVVNEPINTPPSGASHGNYINALGGTGTSGWDWVLNAYRLARQYFPKTKLLINEYSVVNSSATTATYMKIIALLKKENLLDVVCEQAHAFTTFNTPASTLTNNLNILASAGLPIYASELDIDGNGAIDQSGIHVVNPIGDTIQLNEYKRVFPLFWEHPAVNGITLWGYLTGHWRTNQGAFIAYSDGTERPALVWLRRYVQSFNTVLPVTITSFNAFKNNNSVTLLWTASNEVNNDYFEIERSVDATNYQTISTQKSINLNAAGNNYISVDAAPNNGTNYYRVIQVDKNGRKVYSAVKVVNMLENAGSIIQVYPNPANESFTIKTIAIANQQRIVIVTDLSGRIVKTFELNNSGIQKVSTNNLSNGTYFIRITNNNNDQVTKLVVNKNG